MQRGPLRIGQVAREASVGIETIRFYERRGLIPEPPRTASGYRQYPISVVGRLRFINHAKGLGFSLKEIVQLLTLGESPDTTCEDVKSVAEAKLQEIEGKLSDLAHIQVSLKSLVAACQDGDPKSCFILEAIRNGTIDAPSENQA